MAKSESTASTEITLAERVGNLSEAKAAQLVSKAEQLVTGDPGKVAEYVRTGGDSTTTVALVLAARKLDSDAQRASGGVAVAVYAITATGIEQKSVAEATGLSKGRISQLVTEGKARVVLGVTGDTDPSVMVAARKLASGQSATLNKILAGKAQPANKVKAVLKAASEAKSQPREPRPASERDAVVSDPRTSEGAQGPTPAQNPSSIPAGTDVRMIGAWTDSGAWLMDNLATLTPAQRKQVTSVWTLVGEALTKLDETPSEPQNGRQRRQARQAAREASEPSEAKAS